MKLLNLKLSVIIIFVSILLLAGCTQNKSVQKSGFVCEQLAEFGNKTLLGNIGKSCFSKLAEINELSWDNVNPQRCEVILNELSKTYCYNIIAINTKDNSFCEKINDPLLRKRCYEQIELSKKGISMCNQKEEEGVDSKMNCYHLFATIATKLSECNEISPNYQAAKDDCLSYVAIRQKDGSTCKEISDERNRNQCYFQIGVMNNEISSCNSISWHSLPENRWPERNKDECIYLIAMAKGDYSLCEKVDSPSAKNQCYFVMGGALGDTTSCDNIQSNNWKGTCYSYVGFKKNDHLICDKLEGESKDSCIKSTIELENPKEK